MWFDVATRRKLKALAIISMLGVAEAARINQDIRLHKAFSKVSDPMQVEIPTVDEDGDLFYDAKEFHQDLLDGEETELHKIKVDFNVPRLKPKDSIDDATQTATAAEYLMTNSFPLMMGELAHGESHSEVSRTFDCFSSTQLQVLELIRSIKNGDKDITTISIMKQFGQIILKGNCGLKADVSEAEESTIASESGEALRHETTFRSFEASRELETVVKKSGFNLCPDECFIGRLSASECGHCDQEDLMYSEWWKPPDEVEASLFLNVSDNATRMGGVFSDFAGLFSPAVGRKDLCPTFHIFRYFVENSIASIYGLGGGNITHQNLVRALIGNQLEYLCPVLNTGWALLRSLYTVGLPAMLGYGELNVLAFIAMEVAIVYFFVLLMVTGKVSFLLRLWDKFIVGPLRSCSAFLQKLVNPETHTIPRFAAKVGKAVVNSTASVLSKLPRLGIGPLSVIMSVLMGLRTLVLVEQLGVAVVKLAAGFKR